jgi:hypothetical protein
MASLGDLVTEPPCERQQVRRHGGSVIAEPQPPREGPTTVLIDLLASYALAGERREDGG